MSKYRFNIFLDNRRAGHSYLELLPPGEERGDVYGYYPAKKEENQEVLLGKGQVRKDRERLEDVRANSDELQIVKTIDLPDEAAFARLTNFLDEQLDKPNFYFLVGYNCIDFVQDAYARALGEDTGHFLENYSHDELDQLGYVGWYAELRKQLSAD